MDFLVGIKGADFVIMAADCSQARSIVVMKKGIKFGNVQNSHVAVYFHH